MWVDESNDDCAKNLIQTNPSLMESYTEGNWLEFVRSHQIIAVIRAADWRIGRKMAQAVADGGIRLIEITANSDRPWELIAQLRAELPFCSIGVGTVLSLADVRESIACGAEYIFTPHVDRDIIDASIKAEIPIVPGALTPSEIIAAWNLGVTAIKVFPIQSVGGVSYLEVLQGPLGHIPLIPTGGINLNNAHALLAAGAVAVGLAGGLFPSDEIALGDWESIRMRSIALNSNPSC
jgi:2-dehydro-3-deoxyphosphogluconate aldolase / (4S)-4-hydroxy-2-oxoglutarate aldolase